MLTNAVKYAFPNGRAGRIHLGTRWTDEGRLEVMVEDDGEGFNPHESAGGLGQKLIRSLTAQLDGTYECVSGVKGTACIVRFRPAGSSPEERSEAAVRKPTEATIENVHSG